MWLTMAHSLKNKKKDRYGRKLHGFSPPVYNTLCEHFMNNEWHRISAMY